MFENKMTMIYSTAATGTPGTGMFGLDFTCTLGIEMYGLYLKCELSPIPPTMIYDHKGLLRMEHYLESYCTTPAYFLDEKSMQVLLDELKQPSDGAVSTKVGRGHFGLFT